MNFWDLPPGDGRTIALVDPNDRYVSRDQLLELVRRHELALAAWGERSFGLLLCANRAGDIALYLACLRQGHVPLLLAADTPAEQLSALCQLYQPQWIAGAPGTDGPVGQVDAPAIELHPSLGLLLSTSGSTGSPRLVRLSREALQANAASITEYLALGPEERAITSLPMNYSYGLSVINSHLLAHGSLVLNNDSALSRDFVRRVRAHGVTSVAGVPYVYQMLMRSGFFKQDLPTLRTLTQAGGKMDDKLIRQVAEHANATGRRFFVMYGQTEACARISYVPANRLKDKIGSIGVAIPRGRLSLSPSNDELVYEGPNVMLGYAERRDDLARGDELQGRLLTGDLGRVDEEGFFYITGRLKRFIKVSGNRIGLDDVERALEATLQVPVSVAGRDDCLIAWIESAEPTLLTRAREHVRHQYAIHHTMTRLKLIEQLPLLPTGKKDYSPLLSST